MKNNRGITLIILGITIMLTILIASITIYTGINEIQKSKDQKAVAELGMVNHAVCERYITYTTTRNETTLIGQKLTKEEAQEYATPLGIILLSIPDSYNENEKAYYKLSPDDLTKIGIQESQDTYIVNYVTGEVMNITKYKTQSEQPLYTYSRSNFDNQAITAY